MTHWSLPGLFMSRFGLLHHLVTLANSLITCISITVTMITWTRAIHGWNQVGCGKREGWSMSQYGALDNTDQYCQTRPGHRDHCAMVTTAELWSKHGHTQHNRIAEATAVAVSLHQPLFCSTRLLGAHTLTHKLVKKEHSKNKAGKRTKLWIQSSGRSYLFFASYILVRI